MSISYPSSLDSFPNPTSTDLLDNASPTLDHWTQHANVNDAVEALEAKVGADGSAVTTSFDYKLNEVTGTDKAVGKTATQTLTNKTLTAPVINVGSDATGDMYYRNGSGVLTRMAIGASGTIISSTGTAPEWIANPGASDASTTVKGVVELATYAETIARTTTGGTGAKLVTTPDVLTTVLTYDYQADSVGTDSYAITCTPAPTAYTTGMRFTFKASTANTGACSLNVNSLGAKTIKKTYNSDLATGDILANQIVEVVYDGTNFQMVSTISQGSSYTIDTETTANYHTYVIPLVTTSATALQGWTTTSTGTISLSFPVVAGQQQVTAADTAAGAFTVSTALAGATSDSYSYSDSKIIRIKFRCKLGDTTDRKGWGLAITAADIHTAQTDTTNGEIRFIANGATLYAQNANGTATSTDISSGVTLTQWNTYEIIYNVGTNILFYVNGTLKATHTTNLPTTGSPRLCYGANTNNRAVIFMPPVVSVQQ